ncbi:hypothetical protein [Colwellia sp. BRX8-9]|uniref:hypothetical protein n=1 Tax=Colwellia sp. BRX8-9 TaxID=2759831 RepID=UPI0015F6954D|nr:hypothetical protein [Colwellia sp. BRX8-9]MBA6346715.1 hypothetical protein [Colwellia sp. BRX8-9]
MKFTIRSMVLISILGITSQCYAITSTDKTSIEEVKQEAQYLLQTLDAYTAERKSEAIYKTKAALDKLDKRIDALEADVDERWDKMDKDTRKKARDSLKALRKQRNQVAQWYGSLKSSTDKAWKHMKKGFLDAYKALNDAWEKSENEIGSNR